MKKLGYSDQRDRAEQEKAEERDLHERELTDYKMKIRSFESEVEKLNTRLDRALTEKDRLEAKLESSQSELGKSKAELDKATSEVGFLIIQRALMLFFKKSILTFQCRLEEVEQSGKLLNRKHNVLKWKMNVFVMILRDLR